MNYYYIFVLGYDLLYDVLDGIECDIAHDICSDVYNDFLFSPYNNFCSSGYECLSRYVDDHMNEIKAKVEELR
jgi:hypothetical protein